jgi:hypothetical protein
LTTHEEIQIEFLMMELTLVTTFNAYYQIGNDAPVMETVTQTIQPNVSYVYTFTTKADLTFAMDADSLRGWVELIGEVDGLSPK